MNETKKSPENEAARLRAKVEELESELGRQEGKVVDKTAPAVLDLGRTRRKQIKALKRGTGKLMDEVLEAVDEVGRSMGKEAEGKLFVPVVVIYRRRTGRRNLLFPF